MLEDGLLNDELFTMIYWSQIAQITVRWFRPRFRVGKDFKNS